MGAAVWKQIEQDIAGAGVTHVTAKYGPRLVEQERASYLRPTVLHCDSPESDAAHKEYMFPFASVVACPQAEMIKKIGPTLVGTVITNDESLRQAATHATNIDRLNLGPIPTTKLNWLQPHEGNLVEFLYRNRALQVAD
jgi:acyl-CoA reductase-like NAD-dependent aldehyde dehydrogenase